MTDSTSRDRPDVVARPPVLALALLALGGGLDYVAPSPTIPDLAQYGLGGLSLAAGVRLALGGIGAFRRIGTNVPTNQPSTALATDGPYRYSRNPIYVGLLFLFTGVALTVGSLWMLALMPVFAAILRWGVVAREEAYLERKFGDGYRTFRDRTPRWF